MPSAEAPQADKAAIQSFFDSIAPNYDRINRVLSWNLDDGWRRRARDLVMTGNEESILDLGTGTGRFLQIFREKGCRARLTGLDFSQPMLQVAKRELPEGTGLFAGDFHDLPFSDGSFDLVISSFALRSVQEFPSFLKEISRVLTPNGRVGLLCLTRPVSPVWRALAYPYLKWVLPLAGGAISGNRDAYGFLSSSILTFQEPGKTAAMMKEFGFQKTTIHPFTLGLATLIVASK